MTRTRTADDAGLAARPRHHGRRACGRLRPPRTRAHCPETRSRVLPRGPDASTCSLGSSPTPPTRPSTCELPAPRVSPRTVTTLVDAISHLFDGTTPIERRSPRDPSAIAEPGADDHWIPTPRRAVGHAWNRRLRPHLIWLGCIATPGWVKLRRPGVYLRDVQAAIGAPAKALSLDMSGAAAETSGRQHRRQARS